MIRSWRWLPVGAVVGVVVAGAGTGLLAAPDAGASGSAGLLSPAGASALHPAFSPATSSSSDVAGYRVENSAGITSFGATVTVPTLSCPKKGTYSAYLSSQVVGTTASGGSFVHLSCAGGAASYAGFIVFTTVTSGDKHFTVAPGDTIEMQVTITVTKKDVTNIHASVTDQTSGKVTNLRVKYTGVALDTTGWDIFERVGKALVPPFTTDAWSAAMSNGQTLQAADATHFNMTETGVTLVSASNLGATGSSFTNKFHTSS